MSIDEEVIKFKEENMSHNSAEEFLSFTGDSKDNYKPIYLSVFYIGKDENFVYEAELKLAEKSIEKGCKYATNIDYCQLNIENRSLIIAATGLRPKKNK